MSSASKIFTYTPCCLAPGCGRPARYQIAAEWSDGASRELKNYGLACEQCAQSLLDQARLRRQRLILAAGETVGEVQRFPLKPSCLQAHV